MELKKIITSLFEKRDQIEQLANFQKEAFYKRYLGHTITICDTVTDIVRETIVTEDYSAVDRFFKNRSSSNNDNKVISMVKHFDGNSFSDISIKINCDFDITTDSDIYNNYDKYNRQICDISGVIKRISYLIIRNEHTLFLTLENCKVSLAKENWLTEDYLDLPKQTEAYKIEKKRLRLIEDERKKKEDLYKRNLNRKNRRNDLIIVAVLGIIAFLIFRACT